MMPTLRRGLLLAVVLMMVLGAFGCGNSQKTEKTETTDESGTVQHKSWGDASIEGIQTGGTVEEKTQD